MVELTTRLGPLVLQSPLIAASGTVGSVYDFARVGALETYGAAVAKSVSPEPWSGRRAPRLAPSGEGLLNGIGIQNPGIEAWIKEAAPRFTTLEVPVWGSAVGETVEGFAAVAAGFERAGVAAVEVNLSCPNLETGVMFALDKAASAAVVTAVRSACSLPVGAKLSPNAQDVVGVADAAMGAGADWLVLTNTAFGAGIDVETRRPKLAAMVGGYSGAPLKAIALRCVWEVSRALPGVAIVGCGGVQRGADIVEYLLAGAAAVAVGTVHFAEPRAGIRLTKELVRYCRKHDVVAVADLVGGAVPWE